MPLVTRCGCCAGRANGGRRGRELSEGGWTLRGGVEGECRATCALPLPPLRFGISRALLQCVFGASASFASVFVFPRRVALSLCCV